MVLHTPTESFPWAEPSMKVDESLYVFQVTRAHSFLGRQDVEHRSTLEDIVDVAGTTVRTPRDAWATALPTGGAFPVAEFINAVSFVFVVW